MPEFVVENIMKILNKSSKALNGANVLLMGVAYKKDIDDYRESPVMKIIELLESEGAKVTINDPFISTFKHNGKVYTTEAVDDNDIANADIVVITTDHTSYDYQNILKNAKAVYDTRNAMRQIKEGREKIYKL
jgi:UDP-N-acetyl-D-glucosamine dehydrogenase